MKKIGWLTRLFEQQPTPALTRRIAGGFGLAILLMMTGIAAAQVPVPETQVSAPDGYTIHQSLDLGGHISSLTGSQAMYDTLVNIQSGPRVLGETFEMRALPGKMHTPFDFLRAIGSGFGGDPNDFAKLDFVKGNIYEFSGTFRRDRQYFDYDLLGNPNIPSGLSTPYGKVAGVPTVASLAWPQVNQSPVMFNTVRRMTDTSLTIFPLSKLTYRAAYSQNIFQGPTLSPGESVGKYDSLLQEFQRNSTDDFIGAIDWKPVQGTKLTFEEEINHYKEDSYYTLAPGDFLAQEADGTPVSLGNWDSPTPYGIGACNTGSMGSAYTSATTYTIFSAPTTGSLPVINPACDVVTSYMRSQPTRILTPTETVRLQSTSIKNFSMNGNFSYTRANMNLPNYYENFQGLDGASRSITYRAIASAKRSVVSADYGLVWQVTKTVSLSDQIDYSDLHQPGTATFTGLTTLATATNPNETINYGPLSTIIAANGASSGEGSSAINTPLPDYFGQKFLTNNLTGTWDASSRATLSLTYRYRTHTIGEGIPNNAPLALGADTNGTVTINENGGIFNAALRPANHWDLNGTVEVLYDDNAFTPVGPRQTRHYKIHTVYKPKPWATLSGAYNDLERHNNTNNNQASIAYEATLSTPTSLPYEGPLDHVDHSRVVSMAAALTPNEHYSFDFNYAYSDVYAATNICYLNGSPTTGTSTSLPGAVTSSTATLCPGVYARGSTTILSDWFARDFMDAPTQSGSMALSLSPNKKIHSDIGYRVSSVNGTRFFNDARDVNGSLVSTYQTPYVNLAWTIHPGWIVSAEYYYYLYGEGGPSGSPYCSTATSVAGETSIVPCTSATLTGPTGLTEPSSGLTAPRGFRANNVTLSMHYEF